MHANNLQKVWKQWKKMRVLDENIYVITEHIEISIDCGFLT